jgi:hypothetical protein
MAALAAPFDRNRDFLPPGFGQLIHGVVGARMAVFAQVRVVTGERKVAHI